MLPALVQNLSTGRKRDDLLYESVGTNNIVESIAFLASDAAQPVSGVMMPVGNAWYAM